MLWAGSHAHTYTHTTSWEVREQREHDEMRELFKFSSELKFSQKFILRSCFSSASVKHFLKRIIVIIIAIARRRECWKWMAVSLCCYCRSSSLNLLQSLSFLPILLASSSPVWGVRVQHIIMQSIVSNGSAEQQSIHLPAREEGPERGHGCR